MIKLAFHVWLYFNANLQHHHQVLSRWHCFQAINHHGSPIAPSTKPRFGSCTVLTSTKRRMLSVKGNSVSLGPWFPTRTRLQCCVDCLISSTAIACNCHMCRWSVTLLDWGPAMHHKMLQKWRFSDGTRYELKEISPGLASPVKRLLELLDDTILLEMKRMPWYSVAVSSFPYHRWLEDDLHL